MPRDYSAFTARFKELTDPLTRREVGRRIGKTASYITALRQGDHGPSRRLLIRICEAFGLDQDEWFALAGYQDEPEPGMPRYLTVPHHGSAANGSGAFNARGYWADHVQTLGRAFGQDLEIRAGDIPAEDETREQVDQRLETISKRAMENFARRTGRKGGQRGGPQAVAA